MQLILQLQRTVLYEREYQLDIRYKILHFFPLV